MRRTLATRGARIAVFFLAVPYEHVEGVLAITTPFEPDVRHPENLVGR